MNQEISDRKKDFRQFLVERIEVESELVKSFYLISEDGKPIDSFLPGQFLTFKLDMPGSDKPVLRTYSLSCDPFEAEFHRVSIKRETSSGKKEDPSHVSVSNWFHDHVKVGTKLYVKAPRGKFYRLPESTRPVVLISAGIGVTPLLSMLYSISNASQPPESWFIHGARNSQFHSMKTSVLELSEKHKNVEYRFFYSQPLEIDTAGTDFHEKGRISVECLKNILPHNNYDFYLCGPGTFIESLYTDLISWGVEDDNINFESFGPASTFRKKGVIGDNQSVEKSNPIKVSFARSGKTAEWEGTYSNILEFAEAQGLEPDFGCREGICQSCECRLLNGKVEYSNDIEPESEETILICSSVPTTSIEIDI